MHAATRAAAALSVLAVLPAAAAAQAPTAAFEKWNEVSAAVFSGGDLVALDTETVQVRGRLADGRQGPLEFTYYKTEALRVGLTSRRLRFARAAFDTRLAIRTSVGSLSGARLVSDGHGAVLALPGAHGFAPPVVWCCTADGLEVVVESDGRPGASRALAAGFDGVRVRMLLRAPDDSVRLVSASPAALPNPDDLDGTRTETLFPGAPSSTLAAIADGIVAWTENPASGIVRIGVPADAGVTGVADRPVGGTVLRLWAAPGLVVALTRAGAGVRVIRVDPASGAARTVWRGARIPSVAVGGGAVAVADGRTVLAARAGAVSRIATARGAIAAVAVDGDRVAWFERVTRRAAGRLQRWTVARLAAVSR